MTLLERTPETVGGSSLPVLETARLILRTPSLADAKTLATLVNDRRIAEMTTRIPHPNTLADTEGFLATVNRGDGETAFLITARDGTLLGICGIARRSGQPPELGYWLGVPYWDQGFATEAARAVIDHAFADLGYDALVSGARVSNPASRRVLEKCGFQWTGVGLYRIRALNSSAPIDRFRLDRGLWASLKSWGKVQRGA